MPQHLAIELILVRRRLLRLRLGLLLLLGGWLHVGIGGSLGPLIWSHGGRGGVVIDRCIEIESSLASLQGRREMEFETGR